MSNEHWYYRWCLSLFLFFSFLLAFPFSAFFSSFIIIWLQGDVRVFQTKLSLSVEWQTIGWRKNAENDLNGKKIFFKDFITCELHATTTITFSVITNRNFNAKIVKQFCIFTIALSFDPFWMRIYLRSIHFNIVWGKDANNLQSSVFGYILVSFSLPILLRFAVHKEEKLFVSCEKRRR